MTPSPEYHHAKARLAMALIDIEAHLHRHGVGKATKGVHEVVRAFTDAITNLAYDAMNGRITAGEMSRAMRGELRNAADVAYSEGKREGGGKDILTVKDQAKISDWLESQMPHVLAFAKDAAAVSQADDKQVARADIVTRIALWSDNVMNVGGLGYAAAKGGLEVTWIYGDTDHCETCAGLNGKTESLSWFTSRGYIPQERGSEKLECGGWNCQCRLVDEDGKQVLPVT